MNAPKFLTPAMIFDLWDDGRMSTTEAVRLMDHMLMVGECSYETHSLVMSMMKG